MSDSDATILTVGEYFGAYRVLRLLGKGGMGEVYLVEDEVAHASYAVKVLNPASAAEDAGFVARFVREVELAMKVRHPNLVTVYDGGTDPETGFCYSVMEYLPGGTLREALQSSPHGFSWTGVASVATDLARALVCVEANGLVHRDVKPENVLFAQDGTAKLADLGIVRISRPGKSGEACQTRAEAVVGTPAYMSPEQMLDAHKVDVRSDIYSLGMVMYEMIAGRRPNEGQTAMGVLAKALDGQSYPDVRRFRADTPPALAELLASMVAPTAAGRPASARLLLEALTTCGRQTPVVPSLPWYRDRSVLYALAALILSACALGVAVFSAMGGEP